MITPSPVATADGDAQVRTIPQSAVLLQLKQAIELHYFSYDREKIRPLLNRAQILTGEGRADWHADYYAGILQLLWGNILRAEDKAIAYRSYTMAREHLERAHRKASNAETMLWMSAVYGKLASMRTLKMIYYGARSKAFMEEAHAFSQGNPKFFMLAGEHIMHTPRLFGGGHERAREFLLRALDYVEAWKEPDDLVVRWALPPEIWAHLAQLAIFTGNAPEARRYVEQALGREPEYGFVIRDIQPQLAALGEAP